MWLCTVTITFYSNRDITVLCEGCMIASHCLAGSLSSRQIKSKTINSLGACRAVTACGTALAQKRTGAADVSGAALSAMLMLYSGDGDALDGPKHGDGDDDDRLDTKGRAPNSSTSMADWSRCARSNLSPV